MTPHSAPRAIGVASAQDDRQRLAVDDVDEVVDELEDEAQDRDVVRATSISEPCACPP